jgi:threonine/homoserine/homoserine lactone efflux protein
VTNALLPFIGVAIAVVVIPSPDMALVARTGPRRFIRWVSGTVLIGLGVRVAVERT